jgi:hypothetical protein
MGFNRRALKFVSVAFTIQPHPRTAGHGKPHRAYCLRGLEVGRIVVPGMAPYFGGVNFIKATNFRDFKKAMLN